MEALHVHGEWRLYSALLITNSFTNTFAVLRGGLSVDSECLNKTTIFTFKYLGQTLQTKPSPAQSSSSHLRGRERERAQITERLIKRPQTDLGRPFERTFAVTQDDTDRRGMHTHARAQSFKSITVLGSKSNKFNTVKGCLHRYTTHAHMKHTQTR